MEDSFDLSMRSHGGEGYRPCPCPCHRLLLVTLLYLFQAQTLVYLLLWSKFYSISSIEVGSFFEAENISRRVGTFVSGMMKAAVMRVKQQQEQYNRKAPLNPVFVVMVMVAIVVMVR